MLHVLLDMSPHEHPTNNSTVSDDDDAGNAVTSELTCPLPHPSPGHQGEGGVVARVSTDEAVSAAVVIQSAYRGYLCRRRNLLGQHRAAIVIQAAW